MTAKRLETWALILAALVFLALVLVGNLGWEVIQ